MKRSYTHEEKLAILLISLGEETSINLIKNMPRSDAHKILKIMARMTRVDQKDVESIQAEMSVLLQSLTPSPSDGRDAAIKMMTKAFGSEEAQKLQNSLPLSKPRCFDEAETLDPKTLWHIIQREHPQTITMILSQLSAKKSGEIIKFMHPSIRTDVLLRLSTIKEIDPNILDEISAAFSQSIAVALQNPKFSSSAQVGGPKRAAEILGHLESKKRHDFLAKLREVNHEVADEIQARMFTFEDLIKIELRGIEVLLSHVTQQDLEISLRRAPDELVNHIFKAMSERRAAQMRENIKIAKPVAISKVHEAQIKIAKIATDLISSGAILDPSEEAV